MIPEVSIHELLWRYEKNEEEMEAHAVSKRVDSPAKYKPDLEVTSASVVRRADGSWVREGDQDVERGVKEQHGG